MILNPLAESYQKTLASVSECQIKQKNIECGLHVELQRIEALRKTDFSELKIELSEFRKMLKYEVALGIRLEVQMENLIQNQKGQMSLEHKDRWK